jgi:hypothetical protein
MNRFSLKLTVSAGLLASSALSVAAQDASCVGVTGAGQWIGGDAASSDISMAASHLEQLTLIPANTDYVTIFTLSEPADVRVEASGPSGGDTVLELRDAAGNRILEDDDSGGNGASRAEAPLSAGTYCLSTRSFGGDVMMAQVRVGLSAHEPLTAGNPNLGSAQCNAATDALPFADGGPIDGMLGGGVTVTGSATDAPYYRFTLANATQLSLLAENENADPVLYLFDAEGTLLAENDDAVGLNSRIDMTNPLPAGEYCVGVRALSDSDAPITVSAIEYDEAAIMKDMFDNAEASPPLDGSYPVTDLGTLEGRARVDVNISGPAVWHQIDVSQAGLLLVEGIAVGNSDPMLVVYDDVGRLLQQNDDAGGSLDSLVATRVFPGTYVIGVTQPGGMTSEPGTVRLVIEQYQPIK